MTSLADDLIRKSLDLRESGRIDEAIIVAKRATAVDPDNANSWWQLGQAVFDKNGAAASIPHFKKTVELADGFAYGWHRLGSAYKKTGMLDRAVECWEQSVNLDDDRVDSLEALAQAYRSRELADDDDKLFEVLKLLDDKGKLTADDVCNLGIAYQKKRDFHPAIRCYRKYASLAKGPIGYFNLGLALSAPEISQDADAVDSWRRALERDPNYDKAKASLSQILPRLLALRSRVLSGQKNLIGQDQWYAHYINPFELLNLTDIDDPCEIEAKTIKRAKDTLLHEINLADGLVSWVPGLQIDKSRAIKVTEEITGNAEMARYWHHIVYMNKPLLNFMSRCDVSYFLVDKDESPIDLLESIENFEIDDQFTFHLGEIFAAQFDLVFSKAIEKRNVDVIECMLDGRRLVSPKQEGKCFEGAHRQIESLLDPLRLASEKSEKVKPTLMSVRAMLDHEKMGKIIVSLPTTFQNAQNQAAELIRSISIGAFQHHDDADLAKEIMLMGKSLAGRSQSVLLQIEDDLKTLDALIKEKNEAQALAEASMKIDRLLEPLRQASAKSEKVKPTMASVRAVLAQGNLGQMLLSLPTSLQNFQDEATSLIRGISIDAYNHHGDADLAKEILTIAKTLAPKSPAVLRRLNEDMETLDERIKAERKNEASLNFQGSSYSITRKGVFFANQNLAVEDVRTLRWSITVSRSGTVTTQAYSMAIGGIGSKVLTLDWSAYKDLDAQQALFTQFIDAAFCYLMPRVIEMIKKDLDSNQTIRIGSAPVSRIGVTFTIEGWFSNKQEVCPWHRLRSTIDNGEVIITDSSNSKTKIVLPLSTIDNAIALHLLINNQT